MCISTCGVFVVVCQYTRWEYRIPGLSILENWCLPALDQIFLFCPSLLKNIVKSLVSSSCFLEAQIAYLYTCVSLFFLWFPWAPNLWVLLSHLSSVLKNLSFLFHPEVGSWDWLGEDRRGKNVRRGYFHFSLFTLSGLKCVNWYLIAWFLTLPNLSLQGSPFKHLCWYWATWMTVIFALLLTCPQVTGSFFLSTFLLWFLRGCWSPSIHLD